MAALPPAILMLWLPNTTKFIGQSLTSVTVTGHAPVPVEISTQFQLGRVVRKRRLHQRIVGGRGYLILRGGMARSLKQTNSKQGGAQNKKKEGLGFHFVKDTTKYTSPSNQRSRCFSFLFSRRRLNFISFQKKDSQA
jgi:hypothetical protein